MLAPGRLIGTELDVLQILTNLTKVAHNFCGINSDINAEKFIDVN